MHPNTSLTLPEKIGQLFMIGFKGTEVSPAVENFIRRKNIGFAIFFSRNIETIPQVRELTDHLHSLLPVPPFIYTDQEGGTVVHFREMAATVVSPMGLAATGEPAVARRAGEIIGEEMSAVGLDGVLAPTLDVNFEEKNPIIGIRSFSDHPETVVTFAREFAAGLNSAGVGCCGKHYPGHGGTTADSHLEIPEVHISSEYFYHYCFQPFLTSVRRGIDALMTSHVRFPELSPEIATFCPYLINELLRRKAGYDGVVITDCLEMAAVKDNFSPEEIALKSMAAGVDLLAISHTPDLQEAVYDALLFHVRKGTISESRIDQSLSRILELKQRYMPVERIRGRGSVSVVQEVRTHRDEESSIADRSITLLRNRDHLVPFDPAGKNILLVEWQKVKATMPLSSAEEVSMLAPVARDYLETFDVEILPLRPMPPMGSSGSSSGISGELSPGLLNRLNEYDFIIAGLYSRNPGSERLQAGGLQELLKARRDVIAVALGNPYDIRNVPGIGTYLATYGFRRVQIEALFKVLTGIISPTGKLPVRIDRVFPRWYSWDMGEDF